jgi:hypothetical protein
LSGNGNNGTLVNGVGFNGSNLGSLSLDGTNDYIVTGNSGITGNNPWTISMWISVNSSEYQANRQGWIIWEGAATQSTSQLISIAVNSSKVEVAHWSNDTIFQNSIINYDIFQHISVTYDGSQELIYINSINTDSKTTTLNITDGAWYFGAAVNSGYLNYKIGSVQIYNRALTSSEIKQNYISSKGRYNPFNSLQRITEPVNGVAVYKTVNGVYYIGVYENLFMILRDGLVIFEGQYGSGIYPYAAAIVNGTNKILWRLSSTVVTVWTMSSNWGYVSETGNITIGPATESIEVDFNYDLDGDNQIG